MAETPRLNDEDRREWIQSDEGLYRECLRSRKTMRQFIRDNRAAIDLVIRNVNAGKRQAHYLRYG